MKYGLIVKGKEQELPLRSVAVNGQLKGYTVGLDSTLRYRNDSKDPLEVLFRFPVDESMAVVGLEAVIDGRRIRAQLKEKEEAKATYDDAIASGLTAALGEETAGDVFSLSLGNLSPGTEAELYLKLVGELPVDSGTGAVQFSLPTVLKPRYTPLGSQDPLAPVSGEPGQVERAKAPAVTAFKLQVWGSGNVASVSSPTHEIMTEDKDGVVEVALKGTGPLDKDLVILVHQKDPHQPKATVEEGQEGGNELMSIPAVMLDFFPKFESKKAACEFIFVVDRSGSMHGSYINSARETLILFLKSIPPGCYFNIIGFGSSYQHLFPESVPYSQSTLDQAMGHAQSLSADLGGTELLSPINFIFTQKLLPGLPRQVFILTDGSVSNTGACVDAVKKNAHLARVFTFGIGSGASSALVKGLARAGNGSAEFIKEGERMQPKVMSSLKKALQPSVTDVVLTFDVPDGVEVQQSPSKIPPVFNGERLVMYGVLKSKEKGGIRGQCMATLSGKLLGGAVSHTVKFTVGNRGEMVSAAFPVPIIHHLAAKRLISDWQSGEEAKDVRGRKKSIIQLSKDSGVISTHTAYVAVDEDHGKPIEGAMKTWDLTATEMNITAMPMPMCASSFAFAPAVAFGGGLQPPGGANYFSSPSLPPPMGSYPPPPPMGAYPLAAPMGSCLPQVSMQSRRLASSMRSRGLPAQLADEDQLFGSLGISCDKSPSLSVYQSESKGRSVSLGIECDNASVKQSKRTLAFSKESPLPSSSLSQLIALQTAEGFWQLDQQLANIVGQPVEKLVEKCPATGLENVWATVLALTLLKERFSSLEQEWELIAMKAEMWLQNQTIPGPHSLNQLSQDAKQCLA